MGSRARGFSGALSTSGFGAGDVFRARVWGLGFRVQGSGFRVQGSGFTVQGSRFRV